jgi:hypothetical protein
MSESRFNSSRLPHGYHLRHVDANADHHGYFDPAEGAVPNPGMGISGYVVSDHMHVSRGSWDDWRRTSTEPHMTLDRATFDQMLELPHVDSLYFRTEWRDVQRERGKLQIPEAWKWMLEAVEAKDKSWGFRIMNSCPHSTHPNSLPDFLQDRFEMKPYWTKDFVGGPKYFAYYTNEYLDYWQELLQLLAAEFDHHPRLEYVDVSGYGFWGELHPWDMIWAHEHCKDLLENLAQNLGYRLRPSVIWSHRVGEADREIVLGLRNDGSSQVPGVLTVHAEFSNGHSTSVELAPGDPVPGTMTFVPIPCAAEALAGFEGTVRFTLSLRMKGKDHPVQWAIATKNPAERKAIEVPVSISNELRKAR